jgi:carbonic anhydrase/acetyltransferase-like protein (isoleucine patch superfamily)
MDQADGARRSLGFLSLQDTKALSDRGIVIPDPHSILISPQVQLGIGAVLWPGVILQCLEAGQIEIEAGTALYPGTRIVASDGSVRIGQATEIGEEGGFTIIAEGGDEIMIGDEARLLGGGSLIRSNRIGRGAQILGAIRCQNCVLGDGGSYRDPEPDERGGVLKGAGVARHVEVPQGYSIQAFGLFADAAMHRQSHFHPR